MREKNISSIAIMYEKICLHLFIHPKLLKFNFPAQYRRRRVKLYFNLNELNVNRKFENKNLPKKFNNVN